MVFEWGDNSNEWTSTFDSIQLSESPENSKKSEWLCNEMQNVVDDLIEQSNNALFSPEWEPWTPCAHCQKDTVFNGICNICWDWWWQAFCDKMEGKSIENFIRKEKQKELDETEKLRLISIINNTENIFNSVNVESINYSVTNLNSIKKECAKFKSHWLLFKILSWWSKADYSVNWVKFSISNLSPQLGIEFSKMRYKINISHALKNKSAIKNNKKIKNWPIEELKTPLEEIYIAKWNWWSNVFYMKYNGWIERDNATIHFKVASKKYRISKIKYQIIDKDHYDTESSETILVKNKNEISFKVYDEKNQRWEKFNDIELKEWLLYLSESILINHNPYIKS